MDLEKAYTNAIADEHYHREMFQNRLSYHTNVVLVALGAIGAALLQAERAWAFQLLGGATVLIGILAVATPEMLSRIYRHFIEHLDVRERLEVALGLRAADALGDATALTDKMGPRPVPTLPPTLPLGIGVLFTRSWVRAGRQYGYFTWMTLLFRVLGAIASVSGIVIIVQAERLAGAPEGTVAPAPLTQRALGRVGPFEPSDTCVSTPALNAQVTALVERMRDPRVKRLLFVGIADRMPVSGSSRSFGNNTGVALSRARCVAGWVVEHLARGDAVMAVDVRVTDAAESTAAARSSGAAADRAVEVFAYVEGAVPALRNRPAP